MSNPQREAAIEQLKLIRADDVDATQKGLAIVLPLGWADMCWALHAWGTFLFQDRDNYPPYTDLKSPVYGEVVGAVRTEWEKFYDNPAPPPPPPPAANADR
jgi:hypothetical protein